MKINKIVLLAVSSVFILSGCGKDSSSTSPSLNLGDDSGGGGGGGGSTPTPKATLSSWSVSNGAWAARLDINANLSGTPFQFVVKMSDNTEVHCAGAVMTGTESSGTWTTTTCTLNGGMSASMGGIFETGGTGSYSNNGSALNLCRASGSCIAYQ